MQMYQAKYAVLKMVPVFPQKVLQYRSQFVRNAGKINGKFGHRFVFFNQQPPIDQFSTNFDQKLISGLPPQMCCIILHYFRPCLRCGHLPIRLIWVKNVNIISSSGLWHYVPNTPHRQVVVQQVHSSIIHSGTIHISIINCETFYRRISHSEVYYRRTIHSSINKSVLFIKRWWWLNSRSV